MRVFQIENHGAYPIFLEGTWEGGYFDIWYPGIYQQYRYTDDSWHSIVYPPGSFMAPADKIEIMPNGKDNFLTDIEKDNSTLETNKFNTTDQSRIVYIDLPNHQCIYSEPFTVEK